MTSLAPRNDAALAVEAFLSGRAQTTLRAYRADLADFQKHLGADTVEAAATRLLSGGSGEAHRLALAYRAALRDRGLAPATINRRLAALRSLVRLAQLLGTVDWRLGVPGVRSEAYRDTRGPGIEAVRKMLRVVAADRSARGRRDRAILHLLFDLGLRRGEIVTLERADLDLAGAVLMVRGKGRDERTPMRLPEPTVDALAGWLGERGDTPGPLFPSDRTASPIDASTIYRLVRERAASVGAQAAPHGLRHTAITEACKAATGAGIGLEEVLDFSRHRNIAVLMVYRDRERNVQGTLADLVARTAGGS